MATNLLETAKSYLTDTVISRVSSSLNESPESVQKALNAALPLFLAGFLSRSTSPEGPPMLIRQIQQLMTAQPSSPDDTDALMNRGSTLLKPVFGPGSALLSGALSQYAGVKSSSADRLLAMAGAIMTGAVGQQLMGESGELNAGSLLGLLNSQRDAVMAALPAPLAKLMNGLPGMDLLKGSLGAAGSVVSGATGAAGAALSGVMGRVGKVSAAPGAGSTPASTPAYSDQLGDASSVKRAWWPWALAGLLIVGLLAYFLGSRDKGQAIPATIDTSLNDTTSAAVQDVTATTDSAAIGSGALIDSASAATDMAASLTSTGASLGTFAPHKLPDGIELNLPANGLENKLIGFLTDSTKQADKTTWFNFDRLLYETGSARLKPESREQLQNLAAILKAYPPVTLKIGGYTDNTGKPAANKKLSQARAQSALDELVRLGVSKDRLAAEGYGQEHPVASNSTEAGRAQNRRTAVRVVTK